MLQRRLLLSITRKRRPSAVTTLLAPEFVDDEDPVDRRAIAVGPDPGGKECDSVPAFQFAVKVGHEDRLNRKPNGKCVFPKEKLGLKEATRIGLQTETLGPHLERFEVGRRGGATSRDTRPWLESGSSRPRARCDVHRPP